MSRFRLPRGASFETRYCHDPDCKLFGEEQHFAYLPESYQGPSEWIDDPECYECHAEVHEKAPSLAGLIDLICNDVPDDIPSPEDKALFKAARAWAKKESLI